MVAYFEDEDEDDLEELASEDALPDGFWEVPLAFISDPTARTWYDTIWRRLLRENPDSDTMEILRIERAAALYAYIRGIEATTGWNNPTAYRQIMATWSAMVSDLKKTRVSNIDISTTREEIVTQVIKEVRDSLIGFTDIQVVNTVLKRVKNALEAGRL